MTWLRDLYEVYEKNKSFIGKRELNQWGQEVILLPISHTTQTAHIEVNITVDGKYHSAIVLGKEHRSNTVIPCTLESASRSSNIAPYPLHDKLSYVAGDFVDYGGESKQKKIIAYGGQQKTGNEFFAYIHNLGLWASSLDCNWKVKAIYQYLSKKCLIKDLVNDGILYVDENNQLIKKWDKNYEEKFGVKPAIFSAVTGDQASAFVRFNIYSPTEQYNDVWYDQEVANSFIQFYNSTLTNLEHDICYVTGKKAPITRLHANKIRNAADKSKLISSNDETGFTYKGRFETAKQVANISYEASQKAHNALKWLISRQGETVNQRVFLIWGINIPLLLENNLFTFSSNKEEGIVHTEQEYAFRVNRAIKGYHAKVDTQEYVNILILDAATTGRLAVTYYQKLHKNLYLDRLENWFTSCTWRFRVKDKKTGNITSCIKTPIPREIATATHGLRDDKLIKETVERILICMLENKEQQIPIDIERNLIARTSKPSTMENWEWEKCLSVACAVIKHNRKREEIKMTLDLKSKDRNYLFGRLLAVADVAERTALKLIGEDRDTNAMRYMTAFSNQPEKTWKIIREQLHPYLMKLEGRSEQFSKLIDEITNEIGLKNFNNERLDGLYLVGLSNQRQDLNQNKQDIKEYETI